MFPESQQYLKIESRNLGCPRRTLALAVALPFEGIHIEIFYDRIRAAEGFVPPDYLGHVLAHEITHILQSVARHSDSGLMKAHWDRPELVQMKDHLGIRIRDKTEALTL